MLKNLDAAQAFLAPAQPLSPKMDFAARSVLDLTLASVCLAHPRSLVQALHPIDCRQQRSSPVLLTCSSMHITDGQLHTTVVRGSAWEASSCWSAA